MMKSLKPPPAKRLISPFAFIKPAFYLVDKNAPAPVIFIGTMNIKKRFFYAFATGNYFPVMSPGNFKNPVQG